MTSRYAICMGATRLDPDGYNGWPGLCPGCDIDLGNTTRMLNKVGFDGIWAGLNRTADHPFVKPAFDVFCKELNPGDLLVLYYTGHGGQWPDRDGDESDGKDETLCFWSGEIVDDKIGAYLKKIPRGVRTLFITDSCHSGTNFRGRVTYGSRPFRYRPFRQSFPNGHSNPVSLRLSSRSLRSTMLHFGGCSDGRYSYGDKEGGVFTNSLLSALSYARRPISYREWFARTVQRMPSYQDPIMMLWGDNDFSEHKCLLLR